MSNKIASVGVTVRTPHSQLPRGEAIVVERKNTTNYYFATRKNVKRARMIQDALWVRRWGEL